MSDRGKSGAAGTRLRWPWTGNAARALLVALMLNVAPSNASHAAAEPAQSSLSTGRAALDRGDLPQALVHLRLALRDAEQKKERPTEAEARFWLGRLHRQLRRYADARTHLSGALQIDRDLKNYAAIGATSLQLALLETHLGRDRPALTHFTDAVRSFAAAGDRIGVANASAEEAWFHSAQGRPGRALECIDRALLALGGSDPVAHAVLRGQRSTVLADLGRFGEALRDGQGALEGLGPHRATAATEWAFALHNHGNLLVRLGELEAARTLLSDALPLITDAAAQAVARRNLIEVLLDLRDWDGVERMIDQLRAGDEAGARSIEVLRARLDRGRGDFVSARRRLDTLADRALAETGALDADRQASLVRLAELLLERPVGAALPPSPRVRALLDAARPKAPLGPALEGRWWLADARDRLDRGAEALPSLRAAALVVEQQRSTLDAGDPRLGARFAEGRRWLFRALADAELQAGQWSAASLWMERLRALDTPLDPEDRLTQLSHQQGRLADALEQARAAGDAEREQQLDAEWDSARAAFSEAVDRIRRSEERWREVVAIEPAEIEASQRALKPGDAVLQPILLDDVLVLLLYRPEGPVIRRVAVTKKEVLDRINRVLRTMRGRRLDHPDRLAEHLDTLGQWLLTPILPEIQGSTRLLVLADGALRYLPPALLRVEGRYAVERWEVSRLGGLAALQRPSGSLSLPEGSVFALSNPDGTLPAATEEAKVLASLLPGTTVVDGPLATRAALLSGARGRTVVHLATHGVLDARLPERSAFVLAGDSADADPHLRYLDIPGLASALGRTELVVLSACESAVPLSPDGGAPEGEGLEIEGLAAQFRRAGVPDLVASLWQVGDQGTGQLMRLFYEGLRTGRSPAAALAGAQRQLIQDPTWAHPFHWGAFVLIGR